MASVDREGRVTRGFGHLDYPEDVPAAELEPQAIDDPLERGDLDVWKLLLTEIAPGPAGAGRAEATVGAAGATTTRTASYSRNRARSASDGRKQASRRPKTW